MILNNHAAGTTSRLNPLPEKADGHVVSVQWVSSDDEAQGIAEFIKHLIDSQFCEAGDILVLSPRRLLGYQLRDLIVQNAIPVHSFFHEEAVEEPEAQKAVTLLNLLVNPDDKVALRFWLGFGSLNWRAPQYARLFELSAETGKPIRQILDECCAGTLEVRNISQTKTAYQALTTACQSLQGKPLPEVVNVVFPEGSEPTKILREASLLFINRNPEGTVEDLWDHIETLLTQPEMPEAGNFVRIMSLHKSKGLTSKVTIITSCVQGLIPTLDDELPANERDYKLQEQRRLFYVALTRGKDLLVVSSFGRVPVQIAHKINAEFTHRGSYAETMASQFLGELGPNAPRVISGTNWRNSAFQF